MTQSDIFKGLGVKVKLNKDFNCVREQLTRIGIANVTSKTLTQTCHIFHKQGEYAIMHFLEMFQFDGKQSEISSDDYNRRNKIIELLYTWGLIDFIEPPIATFATLTNLKLTIISRARINVEGWKLIPKYTLGK